MRRRVRALVLAILFTLSSIVPMRSANAVVPLAVGLVVSAIGPAGTVAVADLLTAGVSAVIGGVIVALAITPSTADAPMRVPLVSDKPTIDAAIPPPVAPATVAPTATYGYCGGSLTAAQCCASSVGVCNTDAAQVGGSCSGSVGACSGGNCSCDVVQKFPSSSYSYSIGMTGSAVASCPAGTVSTGASCNVVNPRAVAPDLKYDVERTPTGYKGGPSSEADSVPGYASIGSGSGGSAAGLGSAGSSPGKVIVAGRNSSGQPVMIEYAVSADGTKTYITHYTQSESAGQTIVNKQAITVDAATGQVTGVNASASQGSISGSGAGSVPAVDTGAAVTPNTGTNSQPIVFPTDYARAGEAASAANTIKTSIDSLKDTPDVENPEIITPSVGDLKSSFYGENNKVTGLLGWSVPGHVSQCPTASLSVSWPFQWSGTFESHCSIAEQMRGEIAVIFDAVWLIAAFFIVLGA